MKRIKIRSPFFKYNAVGIREDLIGRNGVEVEILYRAPGRTARTYPYVYRVSREKAMACQVWESVRFGKLVRLRLVPISELERLPMTQAQAERYHEDLRSDSLQDMIREEEARKFSGEGKA